MTPKDEFPQDHPLNPPAKRSSNQKEAIGKLAELIHGIDIAMLTTLAEDGTLRSRPMAIQRQRFDGQLWFYTQMDSPKSHEIQEDQRVNVSFAEPKQHRYVSVSGEAELVRDQEKIKEFWSPTYKRWFPEGLEDPNLVLLRVTVDQAEFWDSSGAKMIYLFGLVRRAVTGKAPEVGDHQKLDIAS